MAPLPDVTGYRDLTEIGRGGFARVYRAHQERFNRAVALKVLDLADPDERTRDRFERECRAMGELSWHPHVVAVYDSGVTESGHLWLAMEYLERGSLADAALANGSVLDWAGATTAGIEVCGALGAAHAAGTLHRDLKPENVLVGPFGEARLSDFGIAAVDGGRRTTTGVASFTVAHVAPEVLRGNRQDERTDVYGLASTLHTLLAGRPPFEGEPGEPVATVMMRIIDTPAPHLGEPVPADLADLIVAGLAKDPDDRPQSAAEFGEALQAVQRAHGVAVTPLRLAAAPPSTPTAPPAAVVPPVMPAAGAPGDERATVIVDNDALLARADAAPDDAPPADPPSPPPGDETITVAAPAVPAASPAPPAPPDPPAPPAPVAEAKPSAPGEPAPPAGGGGSRGRLLLIGGAVVVVLALVVGAVVLLGGGDDGGDAEGTFQTSAFATSPNAVAIDAEAVWVTDSADTLIYKLDPETGDEITNTGMNNTGTGIALTQPDAAGWITGDDTADLIRIDLATAADTNQVEVGDGQQSISATGTDVWVTRDRDGIGTIVRLDAIALELAIEIEVGTAPNAVSATDDVVWVTNGGDNTVSRIDPDTNEVTATVDIGVVPFSVAAVEDAVWVVSKEAKTVTRIDPDTNEIVATVEFDADAAPGAIAATSSAVWIIDGGQNAVLFVDPATNELADTIDVGDQPFAVAATDTDVWVANAGDGTLTHIDPAAFT